MGKVTRDSFDLIYWEIIPTFRIGSQGTSPTSMVVIAISLDGSQLPPQHWHLLTKEDRTALLGGTTAAKQFWIVEIQSALAEAALLQRMKKVKYKRGTIRKRGHGRIILVSLLLSSLTPPVVAKEKGLKWKKQRQKYHQHTLS